MIPIRWVSFDKLFPSYKELVPTPGGEPGSGSEAELICLIRHLASGALKSFEGGANRRAELLIRALSPKGESVLS